MSEVGAGIWDRQALFFRYSFLPYLFHSLRSGMDSGKKAQAFESPTMVCHGVEATAKRFGWNNERTRYPSLSCM